MNQRLVQAYRELVADRRKLVVMVVLLVIGVMMWGRLLLQQVPSSAEADPATVVDEPMPITDGQPLRTHPPKPNVPTVTVKVPDRLPRDLFAAQPWQQKKKVGPDPSKSEPASADKQEAQVDASGLTLQSVLKGSRPRAMINGSIIEEGETIQGFTLRHVANRYVVLEKDDQFVQLAL